jgi:hypothetical protein
MNRFFLTLIVSFTAILFAVGTTQEAKTLYVMKQGAIDFQVSVEDIDSIIFYTPVIKDPFDREITGPVVAYSDGGTAEMTNPFFWVRFAQAQGWNPTEVILTPAEIRSAVQSMVNQGNLRLTLPTSLANETTVTHTQLTDLAATYGYTNAHTGRSRLTFTSYVPSFSGSRNVQLGVLTSFAIVSCAPNASLVRDNHETGLEVGEGVVIYAEHGNHYLVKSQNYFGWVLKSAIATVTKEQFETYVLPEKFVIVTAERIPTSLGVPTMLRMGTKLPFVSQSGNQVTFQVPVRNSDGTLGTPAERTLAIDENEYIHIGYLPYTTTNILKQMFKQLGRVYGWGDQNSERDCSSTVWAAYKCSGFLLPRNTGQQRLINAGTYIKSVSGNHATIMNALNSGIYRPGTIVLLPGHVVLYLGRINNNHYIIHQSGGDRQSCKVTGLAIYNNLTEIKAFEK